MGQQEHRNVTHTESTREWAPTGGRVVTYAFPHACLWVHNYRL